jgi:hypothetical protein
MARLGPGDIAPSKHTSASDSHADNVIANALLIWTEFSAGAVRSAMSGHVAETL